MSMTIIAQQIPAITNEPAAIVDSVYDVLSIFYDN